MSTTKSLSIILNNLIYLLLSPPFLCNSLHDISFFCLDAPLSITTSSLYYSFLPKVSYLPRMCLQYSSPPQPSSDEEDIERQSPPLEVSDGETDGVDPGPGIMHGETGQWRQRDFIKLCAEQLLHYHDDNK